MQRITQFGLQKSRFTSFIMIVVLLLGTMAYQKLSKREDPSITIRTAVVTAYFPGMSPEKVEDLIADPLERVTKQLSEVKDINTLVTTGSATLYIDLHDTVPKEDLTRVYQDLRNKMSGPEVILPDGSYGPYVNTNYGDVVISSIAVSGKDFTYQELFESAKSLRQVLYGVKGVGKINLNGQQAQRIWLELDSRKIASMGAQLPQIINQLRQQNVIASAGDINADGKIFVLEVNGALKSVKDVKNVLTQIRGGKDFIKLKDLVTVRRGYVEPLNKPVFFNGNPAMMLGVQMSKGQDIQVVGRNIKAAVEQHQHTQPWGMEYDFSTYQESKVTVAIDDALSNVLQTAGVVLLVLMLFLGIKPALVVACIVPFSVCFALVFMKIMGIELQIVSIAAIIISLGLLVDNGLVMVEDIQRQISQGVEAKLAAMNAGKQFGIPLGVASITTVAAFMPLFLIDGVDGEYGFSLGAVVALMLVGSWLTTMYILPALCVWLANPNAEHSDKPSRLVDTYGVLIKKALPWSLGVVIASYTLVLFSGSIFDSVRSEMFPMSSRSQVLIHLDMPKGTASSATKEEGLEVIRWLNDKTANPEVVNTTFYVGSGGPRFYLSLNPADDNPASGFILVNTQDAQGTITLAKRAQRYLFENRPAAKYKVKRLSLGGEESGIVEIKISGPESERLLALSEQVKTAIVDVPGIIQNEDDWGNKVIKVVLDVAQDKARAHGVTSRDIAKALDDYFVGATVTEYREGTDVIPVVMRVNAGSRDSVADLETLTLPINGKLLSLEQVLTFVPKFELSQLRRENQVRSIKVSTKSEALTAFELLEYIQPTLDKLDLSGGYNIEIDGEVKNSGEVNEMLANGLVPALLVMIAAIMFQFNSYRRVAVIFMTVPFVIIGIPFVLLLTGQPLSFFGTLGMISLAGIIINNAIVLIDQIDIERESQSLVEGILEASKKRVSSILLTTMTTVVGLLPMSIMGGALFESMATLMIGGLLCGTVVSLFFVPSAVYLLFRNESAGKAISA